MRRLLTVLVVALLTLTACSAQPAATPSRNVKAAEMSVEYAWVRTTTGATMPDMTAAFMSLQNPGSSEIVLQSCTASVGQKCELHEMVAGPDGKKMMQKSERGIAVPAGGHLHLEPGSYHIMIMGLTKELAVGDEVELTLSFSDGTTQKIKAPVKKFTEEEDHYHASTTPMPTPSA